MKIESAVIGEEWKSSCRGDDKTPHRLVSSYRRKKTEEGLEEGLDRQMDISFYKGKYRKMAVE